MAGAAVIVAGLSLAGCAGSPAASPSPAPTVTVTATATATVTATPAPVAASPDDAMTPLAAWTACAVLGAHEYLAQAPSTELRPYNAAQPPTKNPDGSYQAIVGMTLPPGTHEGVGNVIAVCTIGGTLGTPTLIDFTLKDI
ncbi:hypothetical protein [Leifsonia poae]|uniref:hypothetical protein n=1 Tax=Leifsonia poae TaxID=110933 RepID=UPI0022F248ED|nr:hypothetical protein [Leifsonia poae]